MISVLFRPRFCTVRLYLAGDNLANEMNFVMNHFNVKPRKSGINSIRSSMIWGYLLCDTINFINKKHWVLWLLDGFFDTNQCSLTGSTSSLVSCLSASGWIPPIAWIYFGAAFRKWGRDMTTGAPKHNVLTLRQDTKGM